MATKKTDRNEIGYAEALEELESILESLEDDDVDVDVLAEHVQRASELISLCRQRISKSQKLIEETISNTINDI